MSIAETIACPNCGATSENRKNCEYCGSLMVRFVDKNIAISDKETFVYNGLIDALENNLKFQRNAFENQVVITTITPYDDFYIFSQVSTANSLESFKNISGASLAIEFQFTINSPNEEVAIANRELLSKFKSSNIYELYTCEEFEYGFVYCINFGEDCEGAAVVLSEFINHVFDYPKHQTLNFNTQIASRNDIQRFHGGEEDSNINWSKVWTVVGVVIWALLIIIWRLF